MYEIRDCYVAMFDVLGFKALRAARGTAGVAQLYDRSMLAMIQHAAAGSSMLVRVGDRNVITPKFTERSVGYKIISDTVIYYTKDDGFDSFFQIVNSSYQLLQFGFSNGQTPFRGAIGHGDLHNNEEIMIGSAVEDAYLGEVSQLWAGVKFTARATAHAENLRYFEQWVHVLREAAETAPGTRMATNALLNTRLIVRYDVPHKPLGETQNVPVLDWTIRMFRGAAEKALPHSTDERAKSIRDNTVAFEQWARER